MSEERNNFDKKTKELLESSMLETPTDDFTNRLMDKIVIEKQKEYSRSKNIRFAWVLLLVVVLLIPFLLYYLSFAVQELFPELGGSETNIYLISSVVIFSLAVLFQFDKLTRYSLNKSRNKNWNDLAELY